MWTASRDGPGSVTGVAVFVTEDGAIQKSRGVLETRMRSLVNDRVRKILRQGLRYHEISGVAGGGQKRGGHFEEMA